MTTDTLFSDTDYGTSEMVWNAHQGSLYTTK